MKCFAGHLSLSISISLCLLFHLVIIVHLVIRLEIPGYTSVLRCHALERANPLQKGALGQGLDLCASGAKVEQGTDIAG